MPEDLFAFIENQLERGVDPDRIFEAFKWCVDSESVLRRYFLDKKAGCLYEKLLSAAVDGKSIFISQGERK